MIQERSTIVPQPCYFDLESIPLAEEKNRVSQERVYAELRLGENSYPARIAGMVGSLWKTLPIQHLPLKSPDKLDVWNPIDYAPKEVFLCTAVIGELEEKLTRFVRGKIISKFEKGKGSFEEIELKLQNKLRHEQRNLMGYDLLVKKFLFSLGLSFEDLDHLRIRLQEEGRNILERVQEKVNNSGASSLSKLKGNFLQDLTLEAKYANLPFQKLLFTAERERWWSAETRREGKKIDQWEQAEAIGKSLIENPEKVEAMIQNILMFQNTYKELESLPQTLVPQDAHPFNIFLNNTDGKTSMLDLEDFSMSARISDLSNVYIFKIIRGLIMGKISEPEAISLIKASLDGYNSEASKPLGEKELRLMADYSKGIALNFLSQFGITLRMNTDELNVYNLAFSLDSFLEAFHLRNQISERWPQLLELTKNSHPLSS